MCLTYNKNGQPAYVRACYRTGHAGLHVPVAEAVWNRGHLVLGGQPSTDQTAPDRYLHFRVGANSGEAEADMIRRIQPLEVRSTEIAGVRYLSVQVGRLASLAREHLVRRAESFGWQHIRWQEGLPVAPPMPVRNPSKRGLVVQWALVATFEQRPDEAACMQINQILGDNLERRWWQRIATGQWRLNAWRDAGWTRQELVEVWRALGDVGGRPYQTDATRDAPHR